MKLSSILILVNLAFAPKLYANECTLADDIKKVEEGYLYSNGCHREVGKVFMENEDRKKQVEAYKEYFDLTNARYDIQKERADLWYQTSKDLEERVRKIDKYDRTENMLYLVGGVVLTVAAGWSLGQASK